MNRTTTKVFVSGRSQAVRIPKAFRLDTEEVYIERRGAQLILTPKPKSWDDYFMRCRRLGNDFPDNIEDTLAEERETF